MEAVLTCAARIFARLCCPVAPSESTSAPSPDFSDVAQVSQQSETAPALAVFLSHSGLQKGFVERLYNELVNAGHSPFYDRISIPRAVLLSEFIKRSTRECRLGVVVLSHDYLMTKWPMMELEIMTNSSCVEILPVFYELSPDDLKDPLNLSKWRSKWKKIAAKDKNIDVNKWEDAVKFLPRWSGEVFPPKTSEALYIYNIVLAISKRILPLITYDVSYTKGHIRLIEEIEVRFNHAQQVYESNSSTCAIGLHGVGGLGKTTLCKMMVNFYNPQYGGKSELMEFPSNKNNKDSILKECKKILGRFTSINETLLEQVDHFDKAVQLMREHMKLYKVFMAIDNIWEHSLEATKRILEVEFAPGSKLLLTSRSEALLKELLSGREKTCVGCVPSMDQKEGLETLKASIGKDLSLLVSQDLLDRIVSLCLFNGSYHALALNTMGQRLRRMEEWNDIKAMHEKLSRIKFSSHLSRIEEVIRSNFESIPSIRQRMFLDVAITFQRPSFPYLVEEIHDFLKILYEGECTSLDEIDELVRQLAFDGLVRFEGRRVVVHDLYLELAQREAASSPRFLFKETKNMEMVEWAKLERVVLHGGHPSFSHFSGQLFPREDCPNLQFLSVRALKLSEGLRLESMTSLRVLDIGYMTITNLTGLRAAKRLAVLDLNCCTWKAPLQSAEVETLTQLQKLRISPRKMKRKWTPLDLGGCRLLKILELSYYGLLNDNGLRLLTNLRRLCLTGGSVAVWKFLPNLSGLVHLEYLSISACNVEEIRGLPCNLRYIQLNEFRSFKRFPDVRTLTQLVQLRLCHCKSLEEIGGLPSNIQHLHVVDCPKLRKLADVEATQIQSCISGLEEVRRLPFNLQNWNIRECGSLQKIGEFPCGLQKLTIQRCGVLQRIPELPSSLELLSIKECESLLEIQEFPSSLRTLSFKGCPNFKKLPTLSTLTQLQKEDIKGRGLLPSEHDQEV